MAGDWLPAGPDLTTVLSEYPRPLHTLSKAEVPSIMVRCAYEKSQCAGLIERFKHRQLMPAADGVELRNGRTRRVDIGVSLANLGGDREGFFGAAATARDLFGRRVSPMGVSTAPPSSASTTAAIATTPTSTM